LKNHYMSRNNADNLLQGRNNMQQMCYLTYQHDYFRVIRPHHLWQRKAERYVRGKGFEPVPAEEVLHKGRPISRKQFQEATVYSIKSLNGNPK
jgi:hypothetical protein